jgi:hypothetical protein
LSDQLATLVRLAENLELDQLRVLGGDVVELIPYSARLVPGAPNGVATDRHGPRLLGDRLALRVSLEGDLDARGLELRALAAGQDRVGSQPGRRLPLPGELNARRGLRDLAGWALQRVHLEPVTALAAGSG